MAWRTGISCLAGLLCVSACFASDRSGAQQVDEVGAARTAFVGVHVIPMTGPMVLDDQTVVVEGDRIVAVGPTATVTIPDGTTVVSANGQYLLPGLVDAHVHFLGSGAKRDLRLYPIHGITSVVNMRGEPAHLRWREEIRRGAVFGPEIYTTGPFVDALASGTEAKLIVREQKRAGYDAIKVRGEIAPAELRALVAAAEEEDMRVVGHVSHPAGVVGVLEAGQQTIEHMEGLLQTFFEGRTESARMGELLDLLKGSDVCITPTLVVYDYVVQQTEEYPELTGLLARPELTYLDPELVRWWRPDRNEYVMRWQGNEDEVPQALDRFRREIAFLKEITRGLHSAGVRLLAGTDASVAFVIPGISLHEELQLLHESGLPPFEVLETATVNPARCHGWIDEAGTVEVGKRADLILLRRNPLEDLDYLLSPAGVMMRGRWFGEGDLERRLPR